jgi:hypothetical protein
MIQYRDIPSDEAARLKAVVRARTSWSFIFPLVAIIPSLLAGRIVAKSFEHHPLWIELGLGAAGTAFTALFIVFGILQPWFRREVVKLKNEIGA